MREEGVGDDLADRYRRPGLRGRRWADQAVEEAFRHLQVAYQEAAAPVLADLTRRAPRDTTTSRFEQDLRTVIPDHADRVLADRAWPALTTTLARAETAGHNTRHLLAEVAAQRELDSAENPAEVLNWRIAAQPNRRTEAARRRSSGVPTPIAVVHGPAVPHIESARSQTHGGQGPRR